MEQFIFPVTRREAERKGIQYSSEKNKKALFPSQLRELRESAGISQGALSKVLGVSKSTISLWETGDTLPDAKSIYDIASSFGVSADYLLGRTTLKTSDIDLRRACDYLGISDDVGKIIRDEFGISATESSPSERLFNWIFEKAVTDMWFLFVWVDLHQLLCFYSDVHNNFTKKDSEGKFYNISGTTISDSDIINARIRSIETNLRHVITALMDEAKTEEFAQLLSAEREEQQRKDKE